jgi:hypothetical protein
MNEKAVLGFSVSCLFYEYSKHICVDKFSVQHKEDSLLLTIFEGHSWEIGIQEKAREAKMQKLV